MSNTVTKIPQDKLELYSKLVDTNPDVEMKGTKLKYTSLNGNMFTYLSEASSLGIRLAENEREAFLKQYNTTLYESHGAVMKEYVTVPDILPQNTNELKKFFNLSYKYAKTLKPKPTKKRY